MAPETWADEEHAPSEASSLLNERSPDDRQVSARIARRLYVSHFLSTWNSRVFEFGAVLYLATIFPGTLLPMSLYALTRGLVAIIFAPAVGHYIDVGNRLQVVRVSIGKLNISVHIDASTRQLNRALSQYSNDS